MARPALAAALAHWRQDSQEAVVAKAQAEVEAAVEAVAEAKAAAEAKVAAATQPHTPDRKSVVCG